VLWCTQVYQQLGVDIGIAINIIRLCLSHLAVSFFILLSSSPAQVAFVDWSGRFVCEDECFMPGVAF